MSTTFICPTCRVRWKMTPAEATSEVLVQCPVCVDDDGAGGVRELAPDRPRNPDLEGASR